MPADLGDSLVVDRAVVLPGHYNTKSLRRQQVPQLQRNGEVDLLFADAVGLRPAVDAAVAGVKDDGGALPEALHRDHLHLFHPPDAHRRQQQHRTAQKSGCQLAFSIHCSLSFSNLMGLPFDFPSGKAYEKAKTKMRRAAKKERFSPLLF